MEGQTMRRPKGKSSTSSQHPPRQVITLVLRHGDEATDLAHARRRISWDRNVRDNPQQLTSKKCCVFHRKRLFGESDSEDSSSSSDGEDDASPEHGAPLPANGHNHSHDRHCNHDHHQHRPAEDMPSRSNEVGADGAATSGLPATGGEPIIIKRKKPRCSKEHCYCGTRFA